MSRQETKKLNLIFGGHSTPGVKDENQDAFTACLPHEHSARKFKGGIACIADGVSLSCNAQLAAQTAVTNFAADYFSTPDYWTVQQSAQRVISAINSWLLHQGLQGHVRGDGFVTTFSALIIKSHTAHILHVGDSRIYLMRGDELEKITHDHTYYHGRNHVLNKALGIDTHLELDYHTFNVKQGDRFALTTDGVHAHIPTQQLITQLQAMQPPEHTSQRIVELALANGSHDNASCLIVDIESLPVERLSETFTNVHQQTIPPALKAGNTLDNYEILRTLHSSTRSHVYLARDTLNEKRSVLKVPSLNVQDDAHYLESFAREQWVGRKLNHPQIIKLQRPPEDTPFLYHVSEYISGQTLRQWMIDHPRPTLTEVRQILQQMIHPVRALQRNKMVHQDLKPENFIIDEDGRVTLIDLGSVKVAGLDEISVEDKQDRPEGDLHYTAPEVLVVGVSTWRSDLFSLAAIVYEMLSGHHPYDCVQSNRDYPKRYAGWKYRPLNSATQADGEHALPYWIDSVLSMALHPKPEYRFNALSEFEQELSKPSPTTLQAIERDKPLIDRNPLLMWQGVCGVLLMVALIQHYLLSV